MGSMLRLLFLLFLLLEVVVMVKVVVGWVDTRISGGGVVAQPFLRPLAGFQVLVSLLLFDSLLWPWQLRFFIEQDVTKIPSRRSRTRVIQSCGSLRQ